MGEPRWTIDTGPVLVWNDRVLPIPIEWPGGMDAYDALVAAVRDAALLRQARQLARDADYAMGAYEEEEADNANDALYALLLSPPPVFPDTPTPTGQT